MSIFGTIDFAIFVLLIAILIVLLVPQLPKFIRKNVVEKTRYLHSRMIFWTLVKMNEIGSLPFFQYTQNLTHNKLKI